MRFGLAGDAPTLWATPERRSRAQKCIPPIIPFGSVLQRVSDVPPPRSSVTTSNAPSDVTSD